MADRGRGGGRGRGRGDFEGRGGGGGGRGGGGRGRGGDGGGRGDLAYRPRGGGGDFGGRGGGGRGGGGDSYGGRGGGGRGGGGDSFGGRGGGGRGGGRGGFSGGGRGGRDKFAGEDLVFKVGGSAPAPDVAVTKLEDDILKSISSSSSAAAPGKELWFPNRPAYGTAGTKVTLWANYFKIDTTAKAPLLKYSVKVKRVEKEREKDQKGKGARRIPEAKGMKLATIIRKALDKVKSTGPVATEFKDQVISLEPLKLPEDAAVVVPYTEEGKDDEYEVKFHGPVTIDLPGLLTYLRTMRHPTQEHTFPKFEDAIDAISIITGFYARNNATMAALGRSRYFPLLIQGEQFQMDYPEYNRIIRGYFQSARPATGRLILNANVSHGVFRIKGRVSDLYTQYYSRDIDNLHRVLNKIRAECRVLSESKDNSKARIVIHVLSGLAHPQDGTGANKPKVRQLGALAKDVQFYLRAPAPAGLQGNTYCSVADYYKKRYGYTVHPDYPVVNVGSKLKPVYMPAELVQIIDGQALKRKLGPDETRHMIEFSCRSPFANATSISTFGREVLGLDISETLKRFGLSIGKSLLTVQGRELTPPTIIYQEKNSARPKAVPVGDGDWNMENVRVLKAGKRIDRWFWISIDYGARAHSRHNDVRDAMIKWIGFMQSQGIAISDRPMPNPNECVTVNRSPNEAIRVAFEGMKKHDPQFVFVVLPGRKTDTTIYSEVKKLGDRTYGYLSQNVLQSNLLKSSPSTFANLGLKVNLKMGGINHKLREDVTIVKQQPTMVVGYDVTHPTNLAGNLSGLPSLVGLVASIDSELGQWPATAWAQTGRVEMLDETLQTKFQERLDIFRRHNNRLPANIIIFRDGVSEGQFAQVLEKELPYIRAACKSVYPPSQAPKISIIVSVKRHQTRFYPTDPSHMVRSRNIKNGTVVDRGVTQATTWDFFLTAHKGLQGTSRPAHYTVLLDEVFRSISREQAANQLEKLTYEMCHLFGRATKAVSICPPAYYADILCTRARVYLSDLFDSTNSDAQSTVSAAPSDVININVHEKICNSMFYI